MSEHNIAGKKVAFLLTDGVEQVELTSPWQAVKDAGGLPTLVALKSGKLQGFKGTEKGDTFDVDLTVAEANASDFDALVLPGGVVNADHLRVDKDAQSFTRSFFEQHKPGLDLPRAVDAHRRRRGARAERHVLPHAGNRPEERRGKLDGPGSGG
jgi:protease I